jgi:hypothetical protein
MSYEEKYLKYKTKYLNLKNTINQTGSGLLEFFGFESPTAKMEADIVKFTKLIKNLAKTVVQLNDKKVTKRILTILNTNYNSLKKESDKVDKLLKEKPSKSSSKSSQKSSSKSSRKSRK